MISQWGGEAYEYTNRFRSLVQIEHHLSDSFRSVLNESWEFFLGDEDWDAMDPIFQQQQQAKDETDNVKGRLCRLLQIESNLSDSLRTLLNFRARELLEEEGWEFDAAHFLHSSAGAGGGGADIHVHGEEVIAALVYSLPDALVCENEDGDLPVHSCVFENDCDGREWRKNQNRLDRRKAPFIPLLVEAGVRSDLFRDEERGGLLVENSNGSWTALDFLCKAQVSHEDLPMYLDILRRLEEKNLLRREDIHDQDVLLYCNIDFFVYCVESHPTVVKDWRSEDDNLSLQHFILFAYEQGEVYGYDDEHRNMHRTREERRDDSLAKIKAAINAGLKYYTHELGFMFQKNIEGRTVLEKCCDMDIFGPQRGWKMIEDCIEETHNTKVFVHRKDDGSITSFSAIFKAAVDGKSDTLSILYYLLRQDPADWILLT